MQNVERSALRAPEAQRGPLGLGLRSIYPQASADDRREGMDFFISRFGNFFPIWKIFGFFGRTKFFQGWTRFLGLRSKGLIQPPGPVCGPPQA
eukprot:3003334-Prymnesium_polylepis.1